MQRPTKAIIAAAGFGTRFLPQTKAMPKEMLPIIDKPIIQYIVEDLVAAGVKDIIIVGSGTKRAIEDHFDVPNEDLLANLRMGGEKKKPLIDQVTAISELANFVYIRQKGPYGNATPMANAAHLIGDEPFFYVFADDIVVAEPNTYSQLIEQYQKNGGSILTCLKVETAKEFESYGILDGEDRGDGTIKMTGMIEKPGKERAPSNFAHVSSFLFEPTVLEYLDRGLRELKEGQEFYVSDSLIAPMLKDGHNFFGYQVQNSKRYDTGDKLEYLKTVVDFGLNHPDLGSDLHDYLLKRLEK